MRRDHIFWGTILILLGGLMFLSSAGIHLPGGMNPLELFWPSVLILLGTWIMMGVFLKGKPDYEEVKIELGNATRAKLELNHGAGQLVLGSGAKPGQFLSGTFNGGVRQHVDRHADSLDAHIEVQPFQFPFSLGGRRGLEWTLNLNRDVPIDLKIESGASRSELDLRDLQVTDLKVSTGASKTEIILPEHAGLTAVTVELGAASLDITVPDGAAARIRAEQGVSAIEIDTTRFPFSNGIYESADYSSATDKADIIIKAGVGRVAVH